MFERLAARLQLDPAEARRAIALATILFGLTGSYTLVKTVRDALFLAQLPATLLPYVFLGVGILTVLASLLFTRVTRDRAVWETLAGASLVTAISLVAFSQLFRLQDRWVPVAFYLWVNVYGLILMAQFWVFANDLSNPREAKRTFGVIGVGGILGGLVGGLVAAPLAHLWTLPTLLVVGAVLQAWAGVRAFQLARRTPPATAEPAVDEGAPSHPLRHPYVRFLALATLCSVMVAALLDYQFKVELQQRYPGPAQLASFIGLFYTASNLGALALQLFGTRWLIQRFGAGWSAAALPTGILIGTAATVAVPGFVAVAATRLWEQIARHSVNKAAGELFYFPLAPALRRRAKGLIEAGLERTGDGLAGILILAVGFLLGGAGTRSLAILVGALVVIWVLAWLGVRRGYVRELGLNLRRLSNDHRQATVSLREASLLQEMARLLENRFERIVLHGIAMLEENAPEELTGHLPALLGHASPRVRARALALVRAALLQEHRVRVEALLQDPDPEVRVQALSTHGALRGEDPVEPLEEFIESGDVGLRQAAILCITEFAPADGEPRVRAILTRLLESGESATRTVVAEALGRRAAPSRLHELLTPLLRDADLAVRRSALRSAGRAQRRSDIPALMDALGSRDTEAAARAGLAGFGDRVVGTLGDHLGDASVPFSLRIVIPRVLSDIRSQEAINALFRYNERGQVRLAYRVLKAANQIRASVSGIQFPRRRISEDLNYDAESYLFALVHYRSCPIGRARGAERLLCIVLNERMEQALNRVFRRLSLLYPPEEMLAAYQGIVSANARLRGNALEYLDNALDPDHRALVLPLVDDTGDDEKLRLAEIRYGLHFVDYDRTLEEILQGDDAWLRTCALYVAGSRRERTLLPLVESNLSAFDALVRETAAWARLSIAAG
ncbi:MAG TPA: Npt1/Npt2 family nucleotide transporter [Candidatus Limnocylindria bacterium]|nr:Npt1/Npt2 family nucleotide transporter [Candidatus Limnocylindria bacterium]